MVFHFAIIRTGHSVFVIGQTGVDLFFVLSGFLITGILLDTRPGSWPDLRTFYRKRVRRIFPLYYAVLLLYAAVGTLLPLSYWLYYDNFPIAGHGMAGPVHFWSLAVEEQFYMVWPFLIIFLPRRWLTYSVIGIYMAAVLARFVAARHGFDIFYLTPTRLDGLAAGALLALALKKGILGRMRTALFLMTLISIAALFACFRMSGGHGLVWAQSVKLTSAPLLYAGFLGMLLTSGGTWVHKALTVSWLRTIGRVSYGMYVFHPFVFALLKPTLIDRLPLLLTFGVNMISAFLVAYASFYCFERRFTDGSYSRWISTFFGHRGSPAGGAAKTTLS